MHSTCFFFALTSSIIITILSLMFIILLDVKVTDLKKILFMIDQYSPQIYAAWTAQLDWHVLTKMISHDIIWGCFRSSPSVYSIIKGHMCKVGKNVDMSSQAQAEPQLTVTWNKVRSQVKVPQC